MKVLLVFPPQWTPFRPYLSVPSLTAYLRDKGITTVQKDFNLESYEIMLSKKYLNKIGELLFSRFEDLDSRKRLVSGTEQKFYHDLFMAKSMISYLTPKIEAAKDVFREPQSFYDPDRLADATRTLQRALSAISMAYMPSSLGLTSFEMPSFKGSYTSLEEVTKNEEENPYLDLYREHFLPFIEEEQPDVIGITVSGESQFIPALTLSRMLKSQKTKAHLTLGGYVTTLLGDVIKNYDELFEIFFDSAILYDGERPLLELVQCLKKGNTFEGVSNLIYKDVNGIKVNERQSPEDINSLPTPDFDGLPLDRYFSPEPVLPLLASRGCYWSKCAFCTHSLAYGLTYQIRDASKVVDDVEALVQKHAATHFGFSDEGTSPKLMSRISDEIKKRGLKVRCSTSIRPEKQFTPELASKMVEAGFKELYIGIESSCKRVLGLIGKGTDIAVVQEVCRNLAEAGIWTHIYIMFGFPGETVEEARQTYDFILKNKDIIRSLGVSNFSIGRGSAVMHQPENFGVTINQRGKDFDFKLYFDYDVESGITQTEGWDLTEDCYSSVATQLYGEVLLNKIGHYYDKGCVLPLYLSHYEDSDPLLKSLAKIVKEKPIRHRHLTRSSKPALSPGVILEWLGFNLRTIQRNIDKNEFDEPVLPDEVHTLFDIERGKFKRITDAAAEVLYLSDGKNSVSAIAGMLSMQHNEPWATMEQECLELFQGLNEDGFLAF